MARTFADKIGSGKSQYTLLKLGGFMASAAQGGPAGR
jgi:hypothetical protein